MAGKGGTRIGHSDERSWQDLGLLTCTPIFTGGDGEGASGYVAAAAAGGDGVYEFGVDLNLDHELALALRVSMEEERARQEATAKRAVEEASKVERGEHQLEKEQVIMWQLQHLVVMVDMNSAWIRTWILNLLLHQSTSQDVTMTENVNPGRSELDKKTQDLQYYYIYCNVCAQ